MSKLKFRTVIGLLFCVIAILAGTVHAVEVGSLTGTASRAGDLGLAGADVFLFQDATQVACTSTDYSGSYTFAAVPFGNYNLKIYVGANELYSSNVTVAKAGTTTVPTIFVRVVDGIIWQEGFENGKPGAKPLGHSAFSGPGGALSSVAYNGNYSWAVVGLAEISSGLRTISVPAVAGGTYTASARYSMVFNGATFYLEFQDANRRRITTSSVYAPTIEEGTWGTVEHSAIAPEGTKYVATILYYAKHATWVRTTYFDDVKIVESGISLEERAAAPEVVADLDAVASQTSSREANDLDLRDHGVIDRAVENGGALAVTDSNGYPYVVGMIQDTYNNSTRTSLLLIDAYTGETGQYWYKQGDMYAGDLFATMSASNGKVYTMFGPYFLEFDIDQRAWTYDRNVGGLGMSFAEGPDGKVYVMRYPTNSLVEFDPVTRTLIDYGRLDPVEKYAYSLVVDQHGWVYAGIGTENSSVVAYHPATRELRQLATADERMRGSGVVQMGEDGHAYGRMSANGTWYRLENGVRYAVQYPSPKVETGAIRTGGLVDTWPNDHRIIAYNLVDGIIGIREGHQLKVRAVRFTYEAEGPGLTSMIAGPEGRIHGSSSHPMRYFIYDPDAEEMSASSVPGNTGGNIANFAVQGDQVVGGAYNGGFLYRFDTTKDFRATSVVNPNPKQIAHVSGPIGRPRPTYAYPDGEHVIMAGFPGYGYVGGGMLIYNLATDKSTLLTAEELLPGHSTMTIRALPDGNLIGGTSVAAPGGGQETASEAKLYIMDWDTQKIIYETEPMTHVLAGRRSSAREINSLELDARGLIYGITSDAQFFVFDPLQRKLVHRAALGQYGGPNRPDQTLFRGSDGKVYALTKTSLLRFDPKTFAPELLAEIPVPVTAGTVLLEGRLYFGSGSRLYSIAVEGLVQ